MILSIPAKTFLLGEYAVLQGYPGILLNTKPCFEMRLTATPTLEGISPASPAGQFWAAHGIKGKGLSFYDPYFGLGGLGASSAQFLGAYLQSISPTSRGLSAKCSNLIASPYAADKQRDIDNAQHLLAQYEAFSWQGVGPRPSGYDVLAQCAAFDCAYVSKHPFQVQPLDWDFEDITMLLVHTGEKCVTHTHLHQLEVSRGLDDLGRLVIKAKEAIEKKHADQLCESINAYETILRHEGWVAPHTQSWLEKIKRLPGFKAAKGCGAMGADVIVILVEPNSHAECLDQIERFGLRILVNNI